jgi:type VI secretion system protein ImpA
VNLPEGFDLDSLLAPIPGDLPQGTDPREDFSPRSAYSRLRDARSNARDAERQAEAPDPDAPSPPDPGPLWRALRELGVATLTETAKDLEVAAWVTEALVRSNGLSGLCAGTRLIVGLAERYWDDIFPLPDDYGMETRVAPVTGLNGREGNGSLMQPIHRLVLFERPDGSSVAFYQYRASAALSSLDPQRREQRIQAGTIAFEDLEKDARTTGLRSLTRLRDEAAEALQAWEEMAALLDDKAGADAPSTSHVRDLLREILEIATRYAPPVAADAAGAAAAAPEPASGGMVASGGVGVSGLAVSASQLATREDALRTLENIAGYFRKTEPHSPLSYTLDEAVRRGRLTWPELMEEIVADRDSRNAMLMALGIRPPPPPPEE